MSGTPDDTPRLSLRAKRILTALVVILPALLCFLAAEIYVRVTTPIDDLWALTGRSVAYRPLADWAFLDAFSAYRGRPGVYRSGAVVKTVNSDGFISTPELTVTKPANTIRIAFLGGSSTAGTGTLLPDSITWPWQTTEILRRHPGRRLKLEFLNGGLGGFTTFESFGRLWSRIRFYQPDIVVVYQGWNEMYYFHRVDRMNRWRTLPDGSWGAESAVPVTVYAPHWYDWLARPSQVLTKVRLRFTQPLAGEAQAGTSPVGDTKPLKGEAVVGRVYARPLEHTFDHRALEVFRTNLRLFKAVAPAIGAELLVGKQATLIVPGLPESERRRCDYSRHGFDHDAHVAAFQGLYRVIDEEIPRDHIIDVTPLSGVPENFHDHVHPTDLGARRTAEIMAAALEPYVEAIESRRAAAVSAAAP